MIMKKQIQILSIFLISVFFFASCGTNTPKQNEIKEPQSTLSESQQLLNFFEANGDFINSKAVPTLIAPDAVYENLDKYLIIDLRSHSAYVEGHIDGAVNVPVKKLLDYFENTESAAAYEKVVLVCYSGQTASYATSILRLLGYGNVYAMKWGMSSWNKSTAGHWSKNISNKYASKLETKANEKPAKGNKLPELKTGQKTVAAILHARADSLLKLGLKGAKIKTDELWKQPENYFVINYWPKKLYDIGHIPGAYQYTPKKALASKEDLYTLPTNKPIVVYCFTGQHAAFATAFLRMLGYDAKILLYGANSFMNGKMKSDSRLGHAFNPNTTPKNYPLTEGEKPSKKTAATQSSAPKKKKKAPVKKKKKAVEEEGGC